MDLSSNVNMTPSTWISLGDIHASRPQDGYGETLFTGVYVAGSVGPQALLFDKPKPYLEDPSTSVVVIIWRQSLTLWRQ